MLPNEDCIQNAPLLQAMLGYAAQGRISFHMPGHQDGGSLPESVRSHLAELDATELSATDDLNEPSGPAAVAMQAAAVAFQAGETLFVTGGSTTAIQAMVTAFCPRGSLIILPRSVHRSVLNIAMLLGLRVVFLPIESTTPNALAAHADPIEPSTPNALADVFGPIAPPTAFAVRLTLLQHPEARAVLVTSPDYFGTCPDLPALASVAAEFGCPLLVDEAHGAHLCFAPQQLPPSAMASGASACVQSAHKTLPALTQGAYLHRSAQAFRSGGQPWQEAEHMRQCLSLYQTSSPSLMIGATLDYARAIMQAVGASAIAAALERIDRFRAALSPLYRCTGSSRRPVPPSFQEEPGWRDPLRVVIDVLETGLTGFEIAHRLSACQIDIEMADIRRLVLIPGLFQAESELAALAAALNRIADSALDAQQAPGMPEAPGAPGAPDSALDATLVSALGAPKIPDRQFRIDRNQALDDAFYRWLQTPPETMALPVSPLLTGAAVNRVPLAEAGGQAVADALIPYPPGIPLIWPGETLTSDRLALLRFLLENGFCVHGIVMERENPCIRVIA